MKEKLMALAKKHGATGLQVIYHGGKFYYFSGATYGAAYFDANESGIQSYLKLKPTKTAAAH